MNKIQIVQNNVKLINNLRKEGKNNQFIADTLGISRSHLLSSIRKLNLKLDPQSYSIDKKQKIIELYKLGFGYSYIEKTLHVWDKTIKKVLMEAGVAVKHKRVELLNKLNKKDLLNILNTNKDIITIEFNPFSNLSEDTVQYWLGYLAGDGCITNNYISLSSIDLKIIKSFKSFLKTKNKIYVPLNKGGFKNAKQSYVLSKGSKNWCLFLHKLGLTNRKTKTLDINFNLTFSFLRGLLDSDGTILLPAPSKKSGSIRWFTASEVFAIQIVDFLKVFVDVNLYNREKDLKL